jgi:predicted nucleic acid-binding protein
VPDAFNFSRDPKDSKYLNLAIAGSAELVVSRDNDLLDLMRSTDAESTAFRTAYPNIRIVDPVAFLQTFPPAAPAFLTPPSPANP